MMADPCEDCGRPALSWEDGVILCDDCAILRAKKKQMEEERRRECSDYIAAWGALRKRLQERFTMARGVLEEEGLGHVAALIPIEEVLIWMDEEEGRTERPTRYAEYPDHPLYRIRQAVLEAARHAMQEAADARDVDAEMVNPIADMVVMDMLPWLKPEAFLPERSDGSNASGGPKT